MYERFIIAILVISVILLALLYYGYDSPKRESNETEDDYNIRMNGHECTYYGSRNLLLIVLIFASGAYIHCLAKKQGIIKGGAIEMMGNDEPNLYKKEENIMSDMSDEE